MRNVVQLCLAANNILLKHKRNHTFPLLVIALALKWEINYSHSKEIHEKKKLGDRMIKQ